MHLFPGLLGSQQREAVGCGWRAGRGEASVLLGCQVVCAVGATVDVAIGLEAVLGRSHHV